MSADQLTAIAAAVLSLAFSYVPGLANKYAPLGEETKRLIMLGLLVLVTAGVFGLACSRFGASPWLAMSQGWWGYSGRWSWRSWLTVHVYNYLKSNCLTS